VIDGEIPLRHHFFDFRKLSQTGDISRQTPADRRQGTGLFERTQKTTPPLSVKELAERDPNQMLALALN
jgi:hypothetical protein